MTFRNILTLKSRINISYFVYYGFLNFTKLCEFNRINMRRLGVDCFIGVENRQFLVFIYYNKGVKHFLKLQKS